MNDVLLSLGKNPSARRLIGAVGLPIPLPEPLRRERGPVVARPLADRAVAVVALPAASLLDVLATTLAAAGADPWLPESTPREPFVGPGETFGRPARALSSLPERERLAAIVVDASGIDDLDGLHGLWAELSPIVTRLARSGRVLVVGRPPESAPTALAAAAQAGLEGFVRSVAKEIGRIGATANLVRVAAGAEGRLDPVVRFVLSARSAFVTAQPISVDATLAVDAEQPLVKGLEKKVALVTGAARGIGAATALRLADEGAHVICLDRPADETATSQLARAIGGTALLVDLSEDGAAARVAEVVAKLGGVDVVVHNAGITRDKTLARMSAEQWDSVLGVNLGAVDRLHAALLPHMKRGARVVCLSSIAGLAGNVGQTAYAASKAGIVGWVRSESARLATKGIAVNAIAPGFIETRLTAAIPVAIREVARRLSALGQGGQPEDVAEAITFLASPAAAGITGRTLRVCGGAFVGA